MKKINKNLLIYLIIILVGIIIRGAFFDVKSRDYIYFLQKWFNIYQGKGGIFALKYKIGDYTPLYNYFIALCTYIPIKNLYLIKILSTIFDLLLAISCVKISKLFNYEKYSILIFGCVFLSPILMLNGAVWGQCDSIYTFFCVMTIYELCKINKDKNAIYKAMIFYGVAFALKLQSIFIAPVILIILLKDFKRFKSIVIVPIIYILSIIPAAILGADLKRLLLIYFNQAKQYHLLTMNYPNFYSLLKSIVPGISNRIASCLGFALIISFLLAIIFIEYKKNDITNERIIDLAILIPLAMVFFLPRMHERYGIIAEVISIIYILRKRVSIPLLCNAVTILTYLKYLRSVPFDGKVMEITIALIRFLIVVYLFVLYYRSTKEIEIKEKIII